MQNIIVNDIRVQLLSNDIVRIEYAKEGKFFDGDTFFIPDKSKYAEYKSNYSLNENVICFGEYELYIPETTKGLKGVRLEKNGKRVYSYKKLANSGELSPLDKTPEVFAISDTPRITVPEGGYSVNRKGEYTVQENVEDIYLLLCNGDAKKLRKLYVELTGRSELVRLSTLGGWNSKYYAYSEEEAKQLILDYERYDVPLDVMVIDTDWRSCENGWGYDINTKLFPDMKRFLDFAHEHNVEVMFNDHPEPVDGKQVFDPEEIAYREKSLQSLLAMGLDIWWYDRNWSTRLISPAKGVNHETLGLYLFDDVTRNFYRKQAGGGEVYRRPVIMGNVDNIANGCYLAVYSSASHRYAVQWTGDIQSEPAALAQEVDDLIRCGNNCLPYVNADCGGHLGNPDKQGFIRWMQFGTLSPVFRPHCTNYVVKFREPWAYDEETLDIVREYNNLRYRLLPVIYKEAYNSYETGEPIFKSLGFEYPFDKTACKLDGEYMLGSDILIKPIAGKKFEAVPPKNFTKPIKAVYYDGTELKGSPLVTTEYDRLDIVLNHTPPEKGVPVYNFSARFETEVEFDRDVELSVRCDDGATVWIDGEKVFEDKTLHSAMNFPLKTVEGGKKHEIKIEYFQAGGEASVALCCCDAATEDKVRVYLPAGKWVDVFDGKIYTGGRSVKKRYGLRDMPIFVRKGGIIPLAQEAHNTKEQKWDRLTFDYYADKSATDAGYIYEDDGETTAYKFGNYGTTQYSAGYDAARNAYAVRIGAAKGKYRGFAAREVTVKCHTLDGGDIKRVTANGVERGFRKALKDPEAFPLNVTVAAPDGDIVSASVRVPADSDCEIVFYIDRHAADPGKHVDPKCL